MAPPKKLLNFDFSTASLILISKTFNDFPKTKTKSEYYSICLTGLVVFFFLKKKFMTFHRFLVDKKNIPNA